jgi:predicted ATP-grasp superfamily ATP-dependent carboligase
VSWQKKEESDFQFLRKFAACYSKKNLLLCTSCSAKVNLALFFNL